MSTNSLGLPLPLPITATFALPLTLYYLLLQSRVVAQRVRTKTIIAQQTTKPTTTSSSEQADPLFIATRSQSNFVENVPLALLLSAFVELNNGSQKILTIALGALTIARVLHVEAGLLVKGNKGRGRPVGFLTTLGVNLGLAGYGAWLVRGYWGF
ncbi:hypothetical protein CB0940_08177 [Cercospora beticola]|uniref:Membrane-associated proteins in eicosanoid and glutathione metabolism n=1 Tax=Cercospora beticola TaxID=122368 RepID=A0A2G5HRF5_CERBT|nr:hypothetical protein CB0940_08177 [Cercospora beticola]PIA95110.1 hypothetical protein CB0940_08177 [Cercospora beticola]CAK1364501.1 unnamed protein product [Cercospora beticola]